MTAARLNKIQRDLIPLVQLNAGAAPAQLAKQLGLRERSVRYQLDRLVDLGFLTEAPFLNIYPLGYRYVNLYFSVGGSRSTEIDQLIQALVRSPQVAWLAELGADFQFGMSLMIRQMEEVKDFLDTFSRRFPAIFFEKSYVFHISLTVFPAKYLSSRKTTLAGLGYGATGQSFAADELDQKILAALAETRLTSGRALARALEKPHATVELRLRRLEKEKIIAGYWYLFDAAQLGYQTLKLLVYAKGHHFALSQKLGEFARQHPNISYFIECLGSWDFELGLDIEDPSHVAAVSRELLDLFGGSINTIKVVPMFRVLKFRQFSL